ncbi:MAG: type II toxin-antitoxin system prevent-host-death family antitoxin [Thermoleophilia bacterium]|jgi:prevent-host-death family protein|nr:type II toxin-antitoxin system prevent-host-death family antitoxin [Thermoleophilia bacterium]
MDTVGIRELKANLSRYVARARAGERIIVTDRGEQVAEIVPLSQEIQVLNRLVKEGRISWSGRRPAFERGPMHGGPSVSDAVKEQREEREQAVSGVDG